MKMSRWEPRAISASSKKKEFSKGKEKVEEDDVVIIDTIEWADPSIKYTSNELAQRPKPQIPDPCGCTVDGGVCCKDEACVLYACQEECYSCLQVCENRRIQKKQWKNVEVFDAGPKGKGLKVLEDVRKGDFIIEYVGRAIRKAYLERLFSRYKTESRLYIMALDGKFLLDARKRGGLARYINHSCEPNCVVQRWKVFGLLRACIFASRDIKKGEELNFDYRWERHRGRAVTKCHCKSPICRGTLEVSKSIEEEELEKQCRAHWCQPSSIENIGINVINRTIRVFSEEHQEYFAADVCKYDEEKRRHLIIYRGSLEEVWEDLSKEKWELLDEKAEQFVIARKKKNQLSIDSNKHKGDSNDITDSLVLAPFSTTSLRNFVNYFYVTTEIKNELHGKGFIANVVRRFSCSVETDKFIKSHFPKCRAEQDRRREALSDSPDGVGWKLIISGANVEKACAFLEKNIAKQRQLGMQRGMNHNGSVANNVANAINLVKTPVIIDEVIIPRCTVDLVKMKLLGLRERCRNVNFQFVPSESKSKQFARVHIEGSLASDINIAKEHLWNVLLRACDECQAPKKPSGFYKDLGFLGGQLSPSRFQMLLNHNNGNNNNNSMMEQQNTTRCQEAHEDLRHRSSFFPSFESTHRCSVWVQSETDMGRIEQNRVVSEYNPTATPRKLYFACAKIADIPKLWSMVEQRANDRAKGIRYFHLGPDRMYQQLMIKNSGKFFEYLQQVTGAVVTLDSVTGDHLRIDGGTASVDLGTWDNDCILTSSDLACLAEELIRLQIELYRDHCIRQQSWIFGRDWSLATAVKNHIHINKANTLFDAMIKPEVSWTPSHLTTNNKPSWLTLKRSMEPRNVANGCLEVAEIVRKAKLLPDVGAHAVVILYRFLKVCPNPLGFKLREIVMACLFLANKAQKLKKWKRLEVLLEVAYPVFFPGSKFHRQEQEATNFEQKVLATEKEILTFLEYDVFWNGVEWIARAVEEAGNVTERMLRDTLDMVLSGPVLAAGGDLWLKYGMEYIFTAVAGFLAVNIEPLFETLSLIPLKVSQAAELIAVSVELNGNSRKSTRFNWSKESFLSQLESIKQVCLMGMTQPSFRKQPSSPVLSRSTTSMRYQLTGQYDNGHIIYPETPIQLLLQTVLPRMNAICAESQCRFYVKSCVIEGTNQQTDLVLTGSWRALSIAKKILLEACADSGSLPTPTDISFSKDAIITSLRLPSSKARSGLLSMKDISTVDGWEGTIQKATTVAQTSKAGGKACVVGRIPIQCLRTAGLRWWNQDFVSSLSAALYEVPCLQQQRKAGQDDTGDTQVKQLKDLSNLALSLLGKEHLKKNFPKLSFVSNSNSNSNNSRKVTATDLRPDSIWAISMQRWPPEKIDNREQNVGNSGKKNPESTISSTGFSPAALQELQLLTQLHKLIPSPSGHPNFTLPIGVAIPAPPGNEEKVSTPSSSEFGRAKVEDMFSLFCSSEENERQARKERKRQDRASGPHLIFAPTPFVLTRVLQQSSKMRRSAPNTSNEEVRANTTNSIPDTLLACWFHDLLSALVHCHTSHVILRSVQTDQIFIDHSGVAKLAGFYRATILSPNERDTFLNPLDFLKFKKENSYSSKYHHEDDDSTTNPYTAPELLMGSLKHTKESDIWGIGSTIAHLLLGKPIFVGKERSSLLTAIYKIVGTPSTDNYPDALKFPVIAKVKKAYKRAVKKAFEHMMKPQDYQVHENAIDLIAQMLHLDPKKRITAIDALQHDCLQNYIEHCRHADFQRRFVQDWLSLKRDLLSLSPRKGNQDKKKRSFPRKIMLEAMAVASSTVDSDDLYNMQDLFESTVASKRRKIH